MGPIHKARSDDGLKFKTKKKKEERKEEGREKGRRNKVWALFH